MGARLVLGNSLSRNAAWAVPDDRTEPSRHGAWRLPFVATICSVVGLGLLSAGLPAPESPAFVLREGQHGFAVGTSVPAAPSVIVARPAARGPSEPERVWRRQGSAPRDSLGNASGDRGAASAVAPIPTPANRSSAGDELIPGPAVPVEERDLRADLFSMSAAQHTGRWTYSDIWGCLADAVCDGGRAEGEPASSPQGPR